MAQAQAQRGRMRRSLLTGVLLLLPLSACIAPSRLLSAQPTAKTQPQALTLYQPLQTLPWEGQIHQ